MGACSAAQGRHLLRGGGGGHEGEGGGRDVAAAGSAEAAVRDPSAGALQARSDTLNSPAVTADALAARQDRGLNNFLNGFDFYVRGSAARSQHDASLHRAFRSVSESARGPSSGRPP